MQPVTSTQSPTITFHGHPIDALTVVGIVVGACVLIYLIYCYLLKRICEKCGTEPGLLIWIPIFQTIRLLQAGGLSGWLFLLFLIPFVNFFLTIYMWIKICQARGKTGWLVLMLFIPVINIFFIPYLAFSD